MIYMVCIVGSFTTVVMMIIVIFDTEQMVLQMKLEDLKYAPAANCAMCISASLILFIGRRFITGIFMKTLRLDTELKKVIDSAAKEGDTGKVKINYPLFLKKNIGNNLFSRVKKDDFAQREDISNSPSPDRVKGKKNK